MIKFLRKQSIFASGTKIDLNFADPRFAKIGKFNNIIRVNELGVVYIGVPKAANTSMKMLLALAIDDDERLIKRVHARENTPFEYLSKNQALNAKSDNLVFSIVRHPLYRLLSCYENKILFPASKNSTNSVHPSLEIYGFKSTSSFEDFCEIVASVPDRYSEIHFRSQKALLTSQMTLIPDLIIKLEDLEKKWSSVAPSIIGNNWKDFEVPKMKSTSDKNSEFLKKHVTKRAIKLITTRYDQDFKLFGYTNEI